MDELLAALGYAGDTLDKSLGGRAVRGVLGGHYDEALSALPFSDTLGLTDPTRRVSGEDLVTGYGLASPGSWGATLGGIGAEMLLDPATLATGGLAAFRGLRAAGKGLSAFGDAGTLARRLAEITPPPALDRRLAELGRGVDPLDRLRVGLRPMARREPGALAHFVGDESGALHLPSPEYPGGVDKLRALQQPNRAANAYLASAWQSPAAEGIAAEIPEGSRILSSGRFGIALETPAGGVIRLQDLADDPYWKSRAVTPEVLQPFRSAEHGGHVVEHLPRVHPYDPFGAGAEGVGQVEQTYRAGRRHLSNSARARGLDVPDLHVGNVSRTPEGLWLTHDPGAIVYRDGPIAPPAGFSPPALIREGDPATLRRALEEASRVGAPGQGVSLPPVAGPLDDDLAAPLSRLREVDSRFSGVPSDISPSELARFRRFLADESGALDAGPLIDRLRGTTPALDRRLAELGADVDPFDRLRASYRAGEGRRTLVDALQDFVGDESGALRPFQEVGKRTDPDVVNRLPWYHGSATPGLTPGSLDALRSSPDNLLGRGLYLTDAADVAAESAAWRSRHHGGEPVVYGAGTDLGRILDLSRPIASDPAAAEAVLAHLESAGAGAGRLARLKRWAAGPDVTHGRFLEDAIGLRGRLAEPPGSDAIVQGLRDRGYDALTHVYGQSSPVGGTPYASLVALDPNDTISKVGRAGQITRFDPHDPRALLRALGLGG